MAGTLPAIHVVASGRSSDMDTGEGRI